MKTIITLLFISTCLFGRATYASTEGAIYDPQGRMIEYHYADGTRESYAYDGAGRMMRFVDRAGRVTTFVYNRDGSMKTIMPDGTVQK